MNIPGQITALDVVPLQNGLEHRIIIETVLGLRLTQEQLRHCIETCSGYLTRYNDECKQCSPNDIGRLMQADVASTCRTIRANPTYEDCLRQVSHNISSRPRLNTHLLDRTARALILFCANVVMLVDVESWTGTETFEDYLSTRRLKRSQLEEKGILPDSFHVVNLQRIGGIRVQWTDLLSEHLSLQLDNKRLQVFKHADMLEFLEQQAIINAELVAETRRTYAILFPLLHESVDKWLSLERAKHDLSGTLQPVMRLATEDRLLLPFSYWRDRLIVLKDDFDNHEPVGLQYFYDRRRPARQWAFLVAVLIFVFGLAQVVLGTFQVYKAYHPTSSPS